MENKTDHTELLLCDCKSTEHQIVIHYDDDPEWDNVYLHVHLSPDAGFWKRLVRAIKYLFGHRSQYGDFDEFIFDPDDANKIQAIATHLKRIKKRQLEESKQKKVVLPKVNPKKVAKLNEGVD